MKLVAGDKEVAILERPYAERTFYKGKMYDGYRIMLDGGINTDQIVALCTNNWVLMDGDTAIETIEGCSDVARHELVFVKIPSKQQDVQAVLNPVLNVLTDDQALEFTDLYPEWESGTTYMVGSKVRYNDVLYKCLTNHISQSTWSPSDAPSLWTKVISSVSGEIPDWEQPDSTNPYMSGDKVKHNDKIWISDIDNNVWEPGVYGWTESN